MASSKQACELALADSEPYPAIRYSLRGKDKHVDRPRYRAMVEKHAKGMSYPETSCVICDSTVLMEDFADVLDVKEFMLSGMCKTCQDGVFS
jgi:hypothetical protein